MKGKRHAKVVELINKHNIETQEELAERLNQEGFQVTQATVSRDIRDLKLTKVPTEGGRQKYTILKTPETAMSEIYEGFKGRICFHGHGSKYTGDQNCFRHGNGSGGGN